MEYWHSFIYLYGVGGVLFALAIFLGLRKGVLNMKRRSDRLVLAGLAAGYGMYFAFQGIWNILAINSASN